MISAACASIIPFAGRGSVLFDLNFCGCQFRRWSLPVGSHGNAQSSFSSSCAENACGPLLRSFAASKNLCGGMCLHAHIIRRRLESNPLLANLLVQMYGQCGALKEASAVFASLLERDHFAWNFLVRSYAPNGPAASLPLFQRMMLEGILPDRFILVGILSACSSIDHVNVGKLFHSCVAGSNMEMDAVIGTAFMNMYTKCGSLDFVLRCFDKLIEEDAASCNALIAAFQQAGDGKSALQVFNQMQQQSVLPERVTFLNVLLACSSENLLAEGKRLHSHCSCTDFYAHLAVETALVNMYGKCNSIYDAQKTFNLMKKHDVVAWNVLIAIYAHSRNFKEALSLFEEMRHEGVEPDPVSFICVLDACSNQGFSLDEDWIRVNIRSSAAVVDMEVGIALMTMYSNCGNLEGAWETFNTSPNRSIAFWNALITVLVKNGKLDDALELIADMYRQDVAPNMSTYNALLDACALQLALVEGRLIHLCVIESHFELDTVTSTSIMNMYSKCSRLDEAFVVFDTMQHQTVVSWNVLISGNSDVQHEWEVIRVSQQMMQEGAMPNDITFLCRLNSCVSDDAVDEGKRIHSCITGGQHESNTVLKTALINMYTKCGSMSLALQVFNDLHERDVVASSAMMLAFVQYTDTDKAAALFNQMLEEGALPDVVSYATSLSALINPAALLQGKRLHTRTVAAAFEMEAAIKFSLIRMYCKCGVLDEARTLFDQWLNKCVLTWNAQISVLIQSGNEIVAFQLYEQMQQEGMLPNHQTFMSILDACSSVTTLTKGHQIHSIAVCNLAGDVKMEAALVTMYAECGRLDETERIFRSISNPNVALWTKIIAANAKHGNGRRALQLFIQMLDEGCMPKRETLVSIFSACSHSGLLDELKELLNIVSMEVDIPMGMELYNCAIDLYSRAGRLDEAEAIIYDVPKATIVSWTTLLGACRKQLDVDRAERATLRLLQLDFQNAEPYVALSNIYAGVLLEEAAQNLC